MKSKSLKVKSCLIIALALVFISALCAAFVKITPASADGVTISGSSVFYTSGEAQVKASGDGTADEKHYTMFVLTDDDDAINYNRNNLAYKWFENSATKTETVGEGEEEKQVKVEDEANPVKTDGWFNLQIGFTQLGFEKFYIVFESQQYVKNKDEKTTNYLVFTPVGDDKVKVSIGDDKDAEPQTTELDAEKLTITFSESAIGGNYAVTVKDGSNMAASGEFKNIGGTFAKYSTSSTTPVTPLSFKAEFAEEKAATDKACMVLYSLNKQSFELKNASKEGSDEYFSGGTIEDDVAPVLCLNENVNYFDVGTEISTSFFTAIDVIKQSPSSDTAYFILTKEQVDNPSADFRSEDMSEDGAFTALNDGDGQRLLLHEGVDYEPVPADYNTTIYDVPVSGENNNDKFTPVGALKIYFKITDTSYNGNSTYVLLDWYVNEDNLLKINGERYLAIASDKKGVTFTHTSGGNTNVSDSVWTDAVKRYEDAVAKAAEGLKAGSKNYFYVPAANELFKDTSTDFTDLSFNVYYMSNTSTSFSSITGKASSLSIPLATQGTDYVFTILAKDAAGNGTYYYKDGEKVEIEASTSDILEMYQDDDDSLYLPWFRFKVGTPEISVEAPKEQDVAYKGTEYSFEFDINAVSGTYDSVYELYVFRNDLYYNEPYDENGDPDENGKGKSLSYEAFMEKKDWLFEEHSNWFDIILSTDQCESGSENEEKYGDYAWNGSGRFTPQQGNAFYLVVLTLSSKIDQRDDVVEYMGIASSIQITPLKGEDTWLRDNMTSVILLCVAGAALIGIVLLLAIRPKNKGDIDEKVFLSDKKAKKPLKPKKK